jgi:methanethiol S-methyltransferase
MGGLIALTYGAVSYLIFFGAFLYAIGFVGNFAVPRSVDAGGPNASLVTALLINAGLLTVFAVQHSVMARPGFKRWWTRLVPESVERSTYVLLSSLALVLMYWQWRPIDGQIWTLETPVGRWALIALFWSGWLLVFAATFAINHFDLFGLRQVWLRFKNQDYTHVQFVVNLFYKYVRHPLLLGFVIAFWATPNMTAGHLLFAVATTGYMLVGIQLEERDLATVHGAPYAAYRAATPMLIPFLGGGGSAEAGATEAVGEIGTQ